jgi:O-methyltransferase
MYLDLLKKYLVRWGDDELVSLKKNGAFVKSAVKKAINKTLAPFGFRLVKFVPFNADKREAGRDWPESATTMIGLKRLQNIQDCVETVLRENIPGDLVEAGVWRGGGSIFMRAILSVYGDDERIVWCADSFQGLPPPDETRYPQDKGSTWHMSPELAVSLESVKSNFKKFDMLDDRVKFLQGWFKDTLPAAPISTIAVLRLDGDMYESTMDTLNALYAKVSPGGFVIVDDYGLPEDACKRAVHDFRNAHGLTEPIIDIDGFGAFWRRESENVTSPVLAAAV